MTAKQQRIMFYSAAIFNWCACLIFFAPLGIAASLDLSHSVAINDGPFDQVALMAIALFGLGYWMVARNPDANRGIVLLGLIGKLAVVAIFFGHYFLVGDVNFNLAGLTIGGNATFGDVRVGLDLGEALARLNGKNGGRRGGFTVVNVADGANVDVGFVPFELLACHE